MENPVINVSSRGLVGIFKLSAMKGITAIACLSALLALAVADGLSEYGNPDYGRVYRPPLDLKMVETRPTKIKSVSQQVRKPRPTPQGLYVKPNAQLSRAPNKKFKPSPQDPYFPSDAVNYAPSHKYLQKYATQLHTTQKNSNHLSEYQKYILGQDPVVKKFVFARAPKKVNIDEVATATTIATRLVSSTVRPIITSTTTEQPRKVEVSDNAAQSTSYKFVFQPEYIPVPVYTTDDKSFSGYDTAAFTAAQHLTQSYSLGDQVEHKIPSYSVKAEDDHHEYPTKEPKYEFQYAVKDHEKNSNFGHAEARQGKTTWGKYYVQLSDGRLETVKYWADKTGYHAEVDYKGHAKHPQSKPKEHAIAHGLSAHDLKLYEQESVTPQLYAISEHTPIEYH